MRKVFVISFFDCGMLGTIILEGAIAIYFYCIVNKITSRVSGVLPGVDAEAFWIGFAQ